MFVFQKGQLFHEWNPLEIDCTAPATTTHPSPKGSAKGQGIRSGQPVPHLQVRVWGEGWRSLRISPFVRLRPNEKHGQMSSDRDIQAHRTTVPVITRFGTLCGCGKGPFRSGVIDGQSNVTAKAGSDKVGRFFPFTKEDFGLYLAKCPHFKSVRPV